MAVLAAAVIGGCADRTKPDDGTKPAEVDDDAAADATTATEQAASFTHPAEIAERIADAGLGCEDFEDVRNRTRRSTSQGRARSRTARGRRSK